MRSTVTRLLLGGFLARESVASGERVVVNASLVRHPEATVLVFGHDHAIWQPDA